MPLLSDSDLAELRATVTGSLPGTAIIQTNQWVSDGGGGGSQTWTAAGTANCRIAPVGGYGMGESVEGGRISADAEFIVTLPSDTDVTTDSRLVITSSDVEGTFNVEAIRDRSWNLSTRVEVVRQV